MEKPKHSNKELNANILSLKYAKTVFIHLNKYNFLILQPL